MGLLSQLSIFFGVSRKQVNVLMIGLDNSGKSTIVNQMKAREDQVTQVTHSSSHRFLKILKMEFFFLVIFAIFCNKQV